MAAVASVMGLLVAGLWIVFGFSTPTSSVIPVSVPERPAYVPSLSPTVLATSGQPPGTRYSAKVVTSPSVRAIIVTPFGVELNRGGVVVQRRFPAGLKPNWTLSEVVRLVDDPSWIAKDEDGVFTVSVALIFLRGAGLMASAPQVKVIHLVDRDSVMLAVGGISTTRIEGVRIDVVPPSGMAPAEPFQPFVLFDNGAVATIERSEIVGLGWDWNMSYGITWIRGATGALLDSTVRNGLIGVYCQSTDGLEIRRSHVSGNRLYGIDPHTGSSHLKITDNIVEQNGRHGIILAEDVTRSEVLRNRSTGNGENGIVAYGRSTNNLIADNIADHNALAGIALISSPRVSVVGNRSVGNQVGLSAYQSDPTGAIRGNVIEGDKQSLDGISISTTANTVDLAADGLELVPPPSWSWIFPWLLWPMVALLILTSFLLRRKELVAGQAELSSAEGRGPPRWWARPSELAAGYRAARLERVRSADLASPVEILPSPPLIRQPERPKAVSTPTVEVGDIGTPPSDRRFRPDIQGLRALAVAMVVAYHADSSWLHGGFVGVDVFFVISGFVITGLLLRERASSGRTSLRGFYAKRARRILPMSTIVIVATIVATYHWLGFIRGDETSITGRWAAVFLANLHFIDVGSSYFGSTAQVSPLLHYWSLAVEEQFYLAFPLLFIAAVGLARRLDLRWFVGAVLVVVVGWSLWLSVAQTSSNPVLAYFSPFTRAWELALGALIAVSAGLLRRIPSPVAATASWFGLAGILAAAVGYTDLTPYPGSAVALPVVATALVIAGGVAAPSLGAELILGRWLGLRLGEISYSLYLWHFPVLVIAAGAAAAPLSTLQRLGLIALAVLLAALSYHFVENPARRSASLRRAPARSLVFGALLVIAVVGVSLVPLGSRPAEGGGGGTAAAGSIARLSTKIDRAARLTSLPEPLVPSLSSRLGIHSPTLSRSCIVAPDESTSGGCVLGDQTATRTIVLLGDSQATMWIGAFDRLASDRGWRLVVLAKDGCPPWIANFLSPNGARWPACDSWHRYEVQRVKEIDPRLLVVTGAMGSPGIPAQVVSGGERLFDELSGLSARKVLLQSIPLGSSEGSRFGPQCLTQHPRSIQSCGVGFAAQARANAPLRSSLATVAKRSEVEFAKTDRLFCNAKTCPPVVGRHMVYYDMRHILYDYGLYVATAMGDLLGIDGR